MTPQNKCELSRFFGCFQASAYANVNLRPKVWYENDRKNMENLLKHKLEKMLIFDQKILEFANRFSCFGFFFEIDCQFRSDSVRKTYGQVEFREYYVRNEDILNPY